MRWVRRVALGALALVVLALLIACAALVFLHTERGGRLARDQLLGPVNETLSGALEVGAVSVRGPRVVLTDVVLRDPDGEVVAEIDVVELKAGLGALFRKTVHVELLRLVRPGLYVVQDEEGTNLQRALEPREPKPDKPADAERKGERSMNVVVDALIVEDGRVTYEQRGAAAQRHVALDDLQLRSTLSLLDGGDDLSAELEARATLQEPHPGPLELRATASGEGERRTLQLDFSAAGGELAGGATLKGPEDFEARVERLLLPPELVRAFVPNYRLVAPLRGNGSATRTGKKIRGEVHLSGGSARIDGRGDFDLETFRSSGVQLDARDVDLSQLVEDGPKSDLHLSLEGRGGGRTVEAAEGSLRLHAPTSRIAGSRFGPIDIDAEANGGVLTLRKMDVQLPGVRLGASGQASEERVSLQGRLVAEDLAKLGKAFGRLAGPKGIPMQGSGAATLRVSGPVRAPRVFLTGRFPTLSYDKNRARDVRVRVDLPNAQRPLAGNARVDVRADAATLGEKRLECPALVLTTSGGAVALDARVGGFLELFVAARGEADADGRGLGLQSLVLRYPEARWSLERPARLRFDEQRAAVDELALRSGEQRLSVDLEKTKRRLAASLQLENFDLARLPKALVDPALQLGGTLSVDAQASGRPDSPAITARVALENGQVRQYRGLSLSLDAGWAERRARGRLQGSGIGIRADGEFDLPVEALQTGRRVPVRAQLALDDFSIEKVTAELGRPVPVRGVVGGTLQLRGTARDPELRVELRGREIVYEGQPPVDLEMVLRTDERGRIAARLDAISEERPGFVELDTRWTLGRLLRHPPTAEQFLRAPVALAARFDRFPLPLPMGKPTLDAEVNLRGAPIALRGVADIAVAGLATGDFPPVDAHARVELDGKAIAIDTEIEQSTKTLLRAQARVEGTIARLRDPKKLPRARWSLEGEWGPLELMELQLLGKHKPPLPGEDPAPLLTGITRGRIDARGTLEDPTVEIEATVHGLGSAQATALGDISVRYRYADALSVFAAHLLSGVDGTMAMSGRVPLELSWSRVQEGLPWRTAPLEVKLDATAFNPTFLSGVSPKLLRIEGIVDARVDVRGSVAVPDVQGQFEWKEGALALAGSGEYRDLHLLVRGTHERIVLEELTAKAGDGNARLSGEAVREGEQQLRLAMKAQLKEFPLTVEDQLAATLSLDGDAKGTASLSEIDVDLTLDEARLELPPSARKELQKLDPPQDVVFLRHGKPLDENGRGVGGSGSAGAPDTREIRVRVNGPRNLWVEGDDLNVEIGLSEDFRLNMREEPEVFGDVKVIRGRLDVFGRRFDLERDSKVTFTGPPLAPRVEGVALHPNEREEVTVTLRVTGTAEDLKFETRSDPPLSETEIYTLLATGRRTLRPGTASSGSGNPAVSVLGGIAAAQLKRGIEEVVPLDVLAIEPGERGVAGTRVEAGTYIGDRLYLGIQSQLGAQHEKDENHNQLNVEYQLWKRWMLEVEYGDARQGSADLLWRKQY